MEIRNTTYRNNNMPAQKLAISSKNKEWKKQCVDAIIDMGSSSIRNGRTSKQNKQVNYDLYNSKFDEEDFEYITKPYGLDSKKQYQTATKMQNYNLIRPNIEVLKGEEIKRPFNFFAKATNGGAVSAKEQRKRELVLQNLKSRLFSELGISEEEGDEPMSLPEIERYINTEFADPREITANQLLKYLLNEEKLEMKFNQGWEHALITAEEYYYVGIINGEPVCRVVNPLDFEHDMTGDVKFVEDAQWCKETRYMSPSSILDTYGDFLEDTELDRLDNGDLSYSNQYGMQPGFAYELEDIKAYSSNTSYRERGIVVINVCWKSWKKIGFVRVVNPQTGETEEQMVDDTFKMPAQLKPFNPTLEWRWINEVWEGTRIGNDIYVNIRPLVNQTRPMNKPSECKLPYTGYIYNNTNSVATSILDLIKPHQYTYNTMWWRFEQELAKSKGKAMVMDLAQMPKTQGFDVEQWLYYFDNLGVAFINSMEEGREGDNSTVAKFNQFQAIDRTVSDDIRVYLEAMVKIETMVDNIVGISQQRRAQTSPSESATANQNSIIQSSHMTEPYFYFHNLLKGQVLTKMLECAKFAYEDGKKIQYIVDEVYTEIINVDGEKFPDSDYGVFVTNSSKDNEIKQKVENLFQVALQQEKLQLSDLIRGLQSDSVTEMSSIIASGEQKFFDEQAKQQQAERDNQKAISDAQIQDNQQARENDNMNKQADRENKIQVATIGTLRGKDGPSDLNGNGIADAIEESKVQIELSKHEADKNDKLMKQGLEMQKAQMQHEQAARKDALELEKLHADNNKFEREQSQQDSLNAVKTQTDIRKSQLEELKLKADIAKIKQDSIDKQKDRDLKLKEINAKISLEQFKAKEKSKLDQQKAKEDAKIKKAKASADIAAKKKSIKTKPKSK